MILDGRATRIPHAVQWATRAAPDPAQIRELVHRLEARALARLRFSMDTTPEIDLAEIQHDLDAGVSLAAVAKQRGLAPSTLRGRLRRQNGAAAPSASNGAGVLQELEQLLDERWRHLSLVERLRRLLA